MSLAISMAVFSLSMSISPGPVNLIALTSGLNNGFNRSLKFVSGATIGFNLLLLLIGLGLGQVNEQFPNIVRALAFIGCAYIFYIGICLFNASGQIGEGTEGRRVPGFLQGWMMQWLNPKAWIACLAGCSAFNVYQSDTQLVMFLSIYFVICGFGIGAWALLGSQGKHWIRSERQVSLFNKAMGIVLCVLSLLLLLS